MQRKYHNRYIIIGGAILAFSFISLIYSKIFGYFAINTESCISGRYFYINRLDKKPKVGNYVAFSFKGSDLYPKNANFIKIVGCTSGQYLVSKQTKNGYGYFCNGQWLGYACNPLFNPRCPKHVVYNGIIPKGYFYAMGTAWDAYDSRYWGLASEKSIIGRGFKIF